MLIPRVIPILLLRGSGIVKGMQFQNHRYIGDPFNAIRIFNTKEVDELLLIDIQARLENRSIQPNLVRLFSSECMMPLTVGGGITHIDQATELLAAGAEKITLNTSAIETPELISEIAKRFGTQSVAVSIDVKKNWLKKNEVYTHNGSQRTKLSPVTAAKNMENNGAGEILLNSIDQDGLMSGYDLDLIANITEAVNIPVICAGGAGHLQHFKDAIAQAKASAVAAGSFFVFHGPRKAVLISYPSRNELEETLAEVCA